jgi:gluconate 2-dehydrogenase gamma chain
VTLLFLNPVEADAVEAMAGRIVPGDERDPGAHEAGVLTYIDHSLAGFMRDQQPFYREALRALDAFCVERQGARFAALGEADQDELLGLLDAAAFGDGPSPELAGDARLGLLTRLFAMLREHTIQGMFCDPAYGGNRDAVGWKLVGFPGARWGYGADEMGRGFDAREIPISTLADLRRRVSEERG